ncbi:MAG: MFS transporter [Alphaproteobacteria bacterium]
MKKIIPLLLVVFLELAAFSMILPILPFLIKEQGGSNLTVTNITGIFALTSFIFAPFWGSLSDRYGRKIILIGLLFMSALNYVWMAFSSVLWMVLLSRIMSGVFAGWMSVVQSWVADLTDKKHRTAALGMIGATFGVGFAIGPAIGGLLIDNEIQAIIIAVPVVGEWIGWLINLLPNHHQFPIMVAGLITALMALAGIWLLPFNRPALIGKGKGADEHRLPKEKFYQKLLAVFFSPLWRDKLIGRYLLLVFLGQVAFSTLESVFAIWGQANFDYTAKDISYIFAIIGMVTIIVQGGLMRWLVKYLGERRVMQIGLLMLIATFLLLNFFPALVPQGNFLRLLVSMVAVGFSLYQPALSGSLSQYSPMDKQGAVLGLAQSLQSLARGLSAIFLGGLFTIVGNNVFITPAFLFIVAFILVCRLPKKILV